MCGPLTRSIIRLVCVLALLGAASLTFWVAGPESGLSGDGPIAAVFSGILLPRAESTYSVSDRSWVEDVEPTLQGIARRLQNDGDLVLVIGYDDPHRYDPAADYTFLERIHGFFLGLGCSGRIMTACVPGASPATPILTISRRATSTALFNAPCEAVDLCHRFLQACSQESSEAVDLCDDHAYNTCSNQVLKYAIGSALRERCGYYVHSIEPTGEDAWTATVSLFSHYPGRALTLDPGEHLAKLDIRWDDGVYAIHSLPYVSRETLSTTADGDRFDIELYRFHPWGSLSSFYSRHATVERAGRPVYRVGAEVIYQASLVDVTGDGVAELVLGVSVGGTFRASGGLLVLQFVKGEVIQRWPDGDPLGNRGSIGYGGEFRDLTGDGVPELIAEDLLLLQWGPMSNLSHALQPFVPIVYTWDGDGYRYASPECFAVYSHRVSQIEAELNPTSRACCMDPECSLDDVCILLAALAEIALCYNHLDSLAEGFHEIRNLMSGWELQEAWQRIAAPKGQPPLPQLLEDLWQTVDGMHYAQSVGRFACPNE